MLINLYNDEKGSVAILAALFMSVLVVCMAFAIDTGNWHYSMAQMTKAAEAGALTGINQLFNFMPNGSIKDINSGIKDKAIAIITENAPDITSVPDIYWGTWDNNTKTWVGTTKTDAPWGKSIAELTTCEVTLRRTQSENKPVTNYFWPGTTDLPMVIARAQLSVANQLSAGHGFPLAVAKGTVGNFGNSTTITTQGAQDDTCGFTSFFDPPGSSKILDLAKGSVPGNGGTPSPEVNVGDSIHLTNGNKAESIWDFVNAQIFIQSQIDANNGCFSVYIPVVGTDDYTKSQIVEGFTRFDITHVERSGQGVSEKFTITGKFMVDKPSWAKNNNDAPTSSGDYGLKGNTFLIDYKHYNS
jgi:Flp pilus assembly protein TadG